MPDAASKEKQVMGTVRDKALVGGLATIGLGLGAALAKRGLASARRARVVPVAAAALGAPQTGLSVPPTKYPPVRRDKTVDVLHGVRIEDPYRWLEDPDSEETKQFVEAQGLLTDAVLGSCSTRQQFKELLTKLYDYPKFGTPFKCGDRYYYYHNSGLQQQYVLYSQATLDSEPSVFLDPNTLSEDGTVALKDIAWTDDGLFAAYSLSSGGSDWSSMRVMSIDGATGAPTLLPDQLEYVKFSSIAWTHDNKGFFYNTFPRPKSAGVKDLGTETETSVNQMLVWHELGTPQDQDVVVLEFPDNPTWMVGASVSDDGSYLLLYISQGCLPANRIYVVDLTKLDRKPGGAIDWRVYAFKGGKKKLPVVKLVDNFDAAYSYIANDGPIFYFRTNFNAPRYRVVTANLASSPPPPPTAWPDLVPQHPKDVLKGCLALKGDFLVVRYLRDVRGVLQTWSLSQGGMLMETEVGAGSIIGLSGDRKQTEYFYSYQSFVQPGATYRVDVAEGGALAQPRLFRQTELSVPHNPDDYETKQVFVASKDGTKIPMFITHRKGLSRDGRSPTLLYGYGGFNVALEPSFSASRLTFIRGYDGVFAQANLRGGGEYGIEWRNAGSKRNKQNVFDDFQACAEYLISEGYCSPAKLTIQGGSNGGLLVAACANQRPDLYACVLGQVGVMDMLRFHKFTVGHAWTTDYGDPDEKEVFEYVLPYSPLHNVRMPQGGTQQYPAVMLATGDHDDRVVPLHSLKLLATLQHTLATSCPDVSPQRNPLLGRIEVRAGHGAGKPTQKIIAEAADLMGFAAQCMQAAWKGPSESDMAPPPPPIVIPPAPESVQPSAKEKEGIVERLRSLIESPSKSPSKKGLRVGSTSSTSPQKKVGDEITLGFGGCIP